MYPVEQVLAAGHAVVLLLGPLAFGVAGIALAGLAAALGGPPARIAVAVAAGVLLMGLIAAGGLLAGLRRREARPRARMRRG